KQINQTLGSNPAVSAYRFGRFARVVRVGAENPRSSGSVILLVYFALCGLVCIPPLNAILSNCELCKSLSKDVMAFNMGVIASCVALLAFVFPLTINVVSAALGDRSSSNESMRSFLEVSQSTLLINSTIALCVI